MKGLALVGCLVVGLAPAQAQNALLRIVPFGGPVVDQDFLILVEDEWIDGCGGDVEMTITFDKIVITATAATPPPGVGCTDALVPFRRIFNPRAAAPGFVFGNPLVVEYAFDAGNGPETRLSFAGNFDTGPAVPVRIQTGSWVTTEIESSGLFIDQQGDLMTALLADYDSDGRAVWFYGAGPTAGAAFSAPLQRFDEIVCVTEPCARVAPGATGRIDIVMKSLNDIVVAVDGLPLSARVDQAPARAYRRLPFARDPALRDVPAEVPDFTGRWLAGVRSVGGRSEDFRTYDIVYTGVETVDGDTAYVFRAESSGTVSQEARSFELACFEVDGINAPGACSVGGFVDDAFRACSIGIPWRSVGADRAVGWANCDLNFAPETSFDLYRAPTTSSGTAKGNR